MALKRIVIAHNFLSPHGGAERSTYKTYQLLQQAGYEVFLFGTNMQPYFEPFPHADLFPNYTNYDDVKGPIQALTNLVKPFYNADAEKKFREFLRRVKPDLVHFGSIHWHLSPSVIKPCLEMNIPTVLTLRESRHICPAGTLLKGDGTYCSEVLCVKHNPLQAILHNCYENNLAKSTLVAFEFSFRNRHKLFHEVLHYICPSQALATLIEQTGTPHDLISVVPNFVDDSWLNQPMSDTTGQYILYAGRLSREKGVDTLLKAMAALDKPFPLKIAGDGPETDQLKALAQTLQLPLVEFMGSVNGESMKTLYRDALTTVLPCNWFENFPRSVLESLAMGTAVIGSDIGGIPEMVIHNETGLLVKPGEVESLTHALQSAISRPDFIKQLGKQGYNTVQQLYNQQTYLQKTLAVYQKVVSDSSLSV
jgi:glycosyltransferase involved in cell wall biosynthesis